MEIETKNTGRFQANTSGNLKGRPVRSKKEKIFIEQLFKATPEILEVIITKAKKGNIKACEMVLKKVLPDLKSVEMIIDKNNTVNIKFTNGSVE